MKIVKYHTPQEAYVEHYLYTPFPKKSDDAAVQENAPRGVYLKEHRKIIKSQTGEDGIIEYVFSQIPPRRKFCVEFGASTGEYLSNTYHLRTAFQWKSLLMDSDPHSILMSGGLVKSENITASNINDLFQKYNVPEDFDFLSIDIDGDDLYIFDALDSKYRPILICAEYNPGLPNHVPLVIEEGKTDKRGGPERNPCDPYDYHGCNIHAWHRVAAQKRYKVLTTCGVNVFLIAEEYAKKFYTPTLEEICSPPYFNIEYDRFVMGASNRENYRWCEIE